MPSHRKQKRKKSSKRIPKARRGTKKGAKRKKKSTPQRKKRPAHQKSTRAQARIPLKLQVQYRVKQNFTVDLSNDISPGGIFIKTSAPLPKDTTVELSFGQSQDPEDPRHVNVEGKVVWSMPPGKATKGRYGMGIEFTRIDVEGQRFIDNIINDFLRKVSIV